MKKPNCYDCKHRGYLAGDAHSCCNHPLCKRIDPLNALLRMLGKGGLRDEVSEAAEFLKVSGDPHGIRRGWFCWPYNFDPTWLESCNGFEPKGTMNTQKACVSGASETNATNAASATNAN